MNDGRPWLIVDVRRANPALDNSSRREPDVKSHLHKTDGVKVRNNLMPIHRRRFRIEEAIIGGDMPMPADGEVGPLHREIMNELRAIRSQMGASGRARSATVETLDASVSREAAEAYALLETYRAQIEQ